LSAGQFPYKWSKPYCGLTHCGPAPGIGLTQGWWLTVREFGSFAELTCRAPGCGFSATVEARHSSVDEAKAAGEAWLRANDQHLMRLQRRAQ